MFGVSIPDVNDEYCNTLSSLPGIRIIIARSPSSCLAQRMPEKVLTHG